MTDVDTVHAVAFDFGGVLTYSAFDGTAGYGAELGLPEGALVRYFRDDPQMARLEVGEIGVREFMKYVCVDVERRYRTRVDIRALAAAASQGPEPGDDGIGRCWSGWSAARSRWRSSTTCR